MSRIALLRAALAAACVVALAGCADDGNVHVTPLPSMSSQLSPHPDHIYLAPFDLSTARIEAGREGTDLVDFKEQFQQDFLHKLEKELNKMAPTEPRWVDDLPDHGWLVAGEFVTIDQGSRALRAGVGLGEGKTTLQTRVYVYDLNVSKTQYVLSFLTGGGSGRMPSGVSLPGEPISTSIAIGSGLKLDTTHTVEQIADVLKKYY
jgi:hypothetical protein